MIMSVNEKANDDDVENAIEWANGDGELGLTFMHTVCQYPTKHPHLSRQLCDVVDPFASSRA